MKKTIAILLILVIGMVGVFAGDDPVSYVDEGSKTITLNTTIAPVSLLLLTNTQYTEYTDYEAAKTNALGNNYEIEVENSGQITGGNGEDDTHIFLTVFSNDRKGYAVSYSAAALENDDGDIIDFKVIIGEDDDTEIDTKGGDSSADITSVSYVSGTPSNGMFSEEITITIDENFDTAVSGVYVGTITFSITSNS